MAAKVMLSVRQCQCLLKTLSIRHSFVNRINKGLSPRHTIPWCHYSSTPEGREVLQIIEDQDDLDELREIERKRDVSRLPEKMKIKLEHSLRVPDVIPFTKKEEQAKRKLYSYYGRSSGLDPSVAWPTREQFEEEIEFEKEFEPSLQDRLARLRATEEAEAAKRREKEELVAKQMSKMPEYIRQYRSWLAKVDAAEAAQVAKRKAIMEDARDHFGFHIDSHDPRFKELQEKKAEEEALRRKKQKKEEKGQRIEAAMKRIQSDTKAPNKED